MNELALFAGAGGGILAGHLLGWRTVCAVELGPYPASVLCARQNDGLLPPFPIWDDVQTFDGRPWRGIVDVVSGGFPCQDISSAGRGAGIGGEKSGLWRHMARIIGEVRPRYAYIENSPMLVRRGLAVVLCDLAALGFDAEWGIVSAADVGAPHKRERIWIVAEDADKKVADADGLGKLQPQRAEPDQRGRAGNSSGQVADTDGSQFQRGRVSSGIYEKNSDIGCPSWWEAEPGVGRVANGVAARVDRLKATGNGQVPAVAAAAFKILTEVANHG